MGFTSALNSRINGLHTNYENAVTKQVQYQLCLSGWKRVSYVLVDLVGELLHLVEKVWKRHLQSVVYTLHVSSSHEHEIATK